MPKLIMPPPMDMPSPPMAARAAPAAASSAEAPAPMSFVAGVLFCYVTPGAAGACRGALAPDGRCGRWEPCTPLRSGRGAEAYLERASGSVLLRGGASFSALLGALRRSTSRAVGKPGGWAAHTKFPVYRPRVPGTASRTSAKKGPDPRGARRRHGLLRAAAPAHGLYNRQDEADQARGRLRRFPAAGACCMPSACRSRSPPARRSAGRRR